MPKKESVAKPSKLKPGKKNKGGPSPRGSPKEVPSPTDNADTKGQMNAPGKLEQTSRLKKGARGTRPSIEPFAKKYSTTPRGSDQLPGQFGGRRQSTHGVAKSSMCSKTDFSWKKKLSDKKDTNSESSLITAVDIEPLEEIQKTYENIVKEYRVDKNAARLLQEYEKLYDALRHKHKEVKAWQLKSHHLSKDIKSVTEKLNLAMHLSQEDKAIISSLNKQVGDSWDIMQEMHERERKAGMAVDRMQDEIYVLTRLVEDGMGIDTLVTLDERTKAELQGMEKKLTEVESEGKERERMHERIIKRLKMEIVEEEVKVRNLTLTKDDLNQKLEDNKTHMDEQDQKIFKLERLISRLRGDAAKMHAEIDNWKIQMQKAQKRIIEHSNEKDRMNTLFRQTKFEKNQKIKELLDMSLAMQKLETHHKHMQQEHTQLQDDFKTKTMMLDAKAKEVKTMEMDVKDTKSRLETQSQKRQKCKQDLDKISEDLKNETNNNQILTKLFAQAEEDTHRLVRNLQLTISNLESCSKKKKKVEGQCEALNDQLKLQTKDKERMKEDLKNAKELIRQVVIVLKTAISEKDRLSRTMNNCLVNMKALEMDYSTQETMVMILRKTITSLEHEIKEQQTRKINAMNERDTLDGLCKKMEMQNSDLTAENVNLVKQTKTLSINVENYEAMVDHLNSKVHKTRKELNLQHTFVVEAHMENKKLRIEIERLSLDMDKATNRINQQDNTISQQSLSISSLTCQRNVLGATCVRNNEHIVMLKEKHAILTDLFKNGAKLYDKRMEEIKFLSMNNLNIWRQKDVIMRKLQNIDSLKSKLGLANQQLVDYKARVKALEDQPPMAVHKYVHMKAHDLTNYELMLKTQHVVKKLIDKTDEVTRLEAALAERSQICAHFKDMLARNPGPELAVKAMMDRKEKQATDRKLKAALAEVNMAVWDSQDAQEERDELRKKLDGERKKSLQLRRRLSTSTATTSSTLPDIRGQGQLPSLRDAHVRKAP